jgi:hypothetical protein
MDKAAPRRSQENTPLAAPIGWYITVLPKLDIVVAPKIVRSTRAERPRNVSGMEHQAIPMHVAAAYGGDKWGPSARSECLPRMQSRACFEAGR